MHNFQVGDRVERLNSWMNDRHIKEGITGTVIKVENNNTVVVEFDNFVDTSSTFNVEGAKKGYCYGCDPETLKVIVDTPKKKVKLKLRELIG